MVGPTDLQTFYVASPTADLIFHAESASEVWFPTSSVFYADDGTIISPIGLGRGAIYTVQSVIHFAYPEPVATGHRRPGTATGQRAALHPAAALLPAGSGPGRSGHRRGDHDL